MGFLDKAKKLADQAQAKVDEVQKDFNAKQNTGSGGPSGGPAPVEYDQHGRPVTAAAPGVPDAPPDKSPTIDPNTATAPTAEPAKRHGDPLLDDEPGSRQGTPPPESTAKPPTPPSGGAGLSSGDPLAG
jgi:hypothetical protein